MTLETTSALCWQLSDDMIDESDISDDFLGWIQITLDQG
jgi:hypothetical protein